MQIEEGKYYRTNTGEKVGPMRRLLNAPPYVWAGANPKGFDWAWTAGGRFTDFGVHQNRDLVAEWVDELAPQQEPVAEPYYERLANVWQAYLHGRDIYPKDVKAMLKIAEIMEDGNG